MISILLRGGLGNVLFQYAVGRNLAIRNNTPLELDLSHFILAKRDFLARRITSQLGHFDIHATLKVPGITWYIINALRRRMGLAPEKSYTPAYEEEKENWGFNPNVLAMKDGVRLIGWFQSEKYFTDIADIIRKDLRLRNPFQDEQIKSLQEDIEQTTSVALHLRRRDYLHSELHNICNIEYYTNAMKYMRSRVHSPRFFVFSDDIGWCRKNLVDTDCVFVDIQAAKGNPVIDLHLMSLCKHDIISNSTFSWWAAWLNACPDKIVVIPNRWFTNPTKNVRALQDTIPGNWTRIDFYLGPPHADMDDTPEVPGQAGPAGCVAGNTALKPLCRFMAC